MSSTVPVNPHLKAQAVANTDKLYAGVNVGGQAAEKKTKAGKGTVVAASATAGGEPENEDKLILTNAVEGKVCTRFPPEASGFIHIGHAKAALVNSMLRTKYKGKMIFRFDDTNPDKENHEFEKAIVEDLKRLGVDWEVGPTYSSDYFDMMLERCDELLKRGLAYCDTADKDTMQAARKIGEPTPCRDNSVERNLELWGEMRKGSEVGRACCVRAKISVNDVNGALRDPTIYRTKVAPHPRHGDKYCVYPTYDFCCPIVDAVEGVTHALRTNEYHDRNAQYDWFIEKLNLRKPILEDFSRLNMEYSLMSKRKLTKLVDTGFVDGWDDPRFPTVRALLRRGLKVDALREFVKIQGMSKAVNFMEWSKLWNLNVQILDPSVPRYTACSADHTVTCKVVGGPSEPKELTRPRHMKNESLGEKKYFQHDTVCLDAEDVILLKPDEEVTLMGWGNAFVKNVQTENGYPVSAELHLNPDGDVKKTKYKLTWVAKVDGCIPLELHEYDQLLSKKKPDPEDELEKILNKHTHFVQKAIGEPAMAEIKIGETFQLERRGYFILDKIAAESGVRSLIAIPDGKEKVNHLSAKAQFYKENPDQAPAPAAAGGKAKGGAKEGDGMTLEEKRAAKAAKKAASGKKKEEKKE